MKTEKEKMRAGEAYNASDSELVAERLSAREKVYDYNLLRPSQMKERDEIIRKFFGSTQKTFLIEQGIHCDYGYNIHIGENFYANVGCTFLDGALIRIGDNVLLGPNVGLYTAEHPHDVKKRNEAIEYAYPITIGNNVWIGADVTIVPGVTIGDNTVIGAGSVVTKDIPKNVLAVGNPCRVIKENINWYRRLGRRDISIFGKWKKDFIWEQTQLNFTDASRAMKIVMNIYQN